MNRINIYADTDPDRLGKAQLAGWFDLDKAESFSGDTGSEWDHEVLYRTSQGRWALHAWTSDRRGGGYDNWSFVASADAQDWLIRNEFDASVAKYFGELEEERGPGRPAVGEPVNIRLGDELLTMVDSYAANRSISRAEAIRRLIQDAVTRARVGDGMPLTPAVNR